MNFEDKKTVIISALMALLLITLSFSRIKNYESSDFSFSLPLPSINEMISEGLESEEDKMSAEDIALERESYDKNLIDEKIEFLYPSRWEVITTEERYETENTSVIFIAQSKDFIYPPSITVLKITAPSIEELIEIIKEETRVGGLRMDIVKIEEEDGTFLESINTYGGMESFSRKKVIFLEDKYYIFSVTVFEKDKLMYEPVIDDILSSIKVL